MELDFSIVASSGTYDAVPESFCRLLVTNIKHNYPDFPRGAPSAERHTFVPVTPPPTPSWPRHDLQRLRHQC